MSETGNGSDTLASLSRGEQPRAQQDTEGLWDPLTTTYASKAEFIDKCSTESALQGFRLWVGEGRNLKDPEGIAAGRVELSCYKFRLKDEHGKRTRVGGCRFSLKAVMVYDKKVQFADRKWQFVAGVFVHNHDCGPPLSQPKKFGVRVPRKLSKKSKKNAVPDAPTLPTPEASTSSLSPPEEAVTQPDVGHWKEREYELSTNATPIEPLSIVDATESHRNIAIFDPDEFGDGTRGSGTSSDSMLKLDTHITTSLPIGHATLLSSDDDVSPDYLALDFPPPFLSHALPIDHATLLSLDQHTPSFDDPFGLLQQSATNISIAIFLKTEGKDLEQYAEGFSLSGYCDTDSLLIPSDAVLSHFLTSDLLTLCPTLQSNAYHQQVITSLVVAHRLQRSTPSFQNHSQTLDHLFHNSDLPLVLPPIDDVELGLERGTKRPFDVFQFSNAADSIEFLS